MSGKGKNDSAVKVTLNGVTEAGLQVSKLALETNAKAGISLGVKSKPGFNAYAIAGSSKNDVSIVKDFTPKYPFGQTSKEYSQLLPFVEGKLEYCPAEHSGVYGRASALAQLDLKHNSASPLTKCNVFEAEAGFRNYSKTDRCGVGGIAEIGVISRFENYPENAILNNSSTCVKFQGGGLKDRFNIALKAGVQHMPGVADKIPAEYGVKPVSFCVGATLRYAL